MAPWSSPGAHVPIAGAFSSGHRDHVAARCDAPLAASAIAAVDEIRQARLDPPCVSVSCRCTRPVSSFAGHPSSALGTPSQHLAGFGEAPALVATQLGWSHVEVTHILSLLPFSPAAKFTSATNRCHCNDDPYDSLHVSAVSVLQLLSADMYSLLKIVPDICVFKDFGALCFHELKCT